MSRDPRLSLAALKMVAQMNPQSAIAAGAIALVGSAVIGGIFLYEEYQAAQKAEIEREIHQINEFYQQHLEKIIEIAGENIGFTPPFEKQEGGGWRSTRWTNAQVISAGQHALSSIEQQTPLDYYRYHLNEALNRLKTYYFAHTEKKLESTTVKVITYLLSIIEKLFEYEGREVDIAILDSVMRFVLKCAGMRGPHAQHFTALMPVYEHLKHAKIKGLKKHEEIWPLEETVAELRVTVKRVSEEMVRHFVKFTVPQSEWSRLRFASIDLLAAGVKHDAAASRCCGLWHTSAEERLPNTIITQWVRVLAEYYENTMEAFKNLTEIPGNIVFLVPPVISNENLKYIENIFESAPVSGKMAQTKTRALLFALSEYAKLIHYIISYLRLIDQLQEVFKKLGEFESRNPNHCAKLYRFFDELSQKIVVQADVVQDQFEVLAEVGGRRWVDQETLILNIERELDQIGKYIKEKSHHVRHRRHKMDAKQLLLEEKALRAQESQMVDALRDACGFQPDESVKTSVVETTVSSERGSVHPQHGPLPKLPKSLPIRQATNNTLPAGRYVGPKDAVRVTPLPTLLKPRVAPDIQTRFSEGEAAVTEETPAVKLLGGILILLEDYTGEHSKTPRLTTFGRHYVGQILPIIAQIREALQSTNTDMSVELSKVLRALVDLHASENFKKGTMNERIVWIVYQCALRNFHPAPLTLTAVAS